MGSARSASAYHPANTNPLDGFAEIDTFLPSAYTPVPDAAPAAASVETALTG